MESGLKGAEPSTEAGADRVSWFPSEPGHTKLGQQHIFTKPGEKVKFRPYRKPIETLPEARRDVVRTEVARAPTHHTEIDGPIVSMQWPTLRKLSSSGRPM